MSVTTDKSFLKMALLEYIDFPDDILSKFLPPLEFGLAAPMVMFSRLPSLVEAKLEPSGI